MYFYLPLVPVTVDLVPEHVGHASLHVDDGGEAVLRHDLSELGVLVTSDSEPGTQTIFCQNVEMTFVLTSNNKYCYQSLSWPTHPPQPRCFVQTSGDQNLSNPTRKLQYITNYHFNKELL